MFYKLNVKPVDSDCPLKRCILANDTNSLERVLRNRKNPNQLQADSKGWTALHLAASKDEYADCLKELLRNKDALRLDLEAETYCGETAFFLACMKGCEMNCRILLEGQCNPELRNMRGYTPLHIASIYGHANIVSQLIARGLNPNCLTTRNESTPLHCASAEGNLNVVRVLLTSKRTKVNIRNRFGELPLYVACQKGFIEIVRILSDADYRLVNCCCHGTSTPLLIAMQYLMRDSKKGHLECVKYLLHRGVNVNCCTLIHETTLCYAAQIGVKEVLSLVLQRIIPMYVRQELIMNIKGVLSDDWRIFDSLMSRVMNSRSPECMLLLLKSGLPKSILEAPYIENRYPHFRDVYSPLAYLFSRLIIFSRDELDDFLALLLEHRITHLYEFSRMVKLKVAHPLTIRYVHPFTNIFKGPWLTMERNHYLNMLFKNGITTDFALECDVHYNSPFQYFDVNVLERFYEPVVLTIKEDNAGLIELLLGNSAILEPFHLWNFLQCRTSVTAGWENPQNVVNYLIDLGIVVDTSNLPLYPFGGTIKCPNLQQLCRQTIRKHLRDLTIQDNLKNFKQKVNALPLPNLLKNYLNFMRK